MCGSPPSVLWDLGWGWDKEPKLLAGLIGSSVNTHKLRWRESFVAQATISPSSTYLVLCAQSFGLAAVSTVCGCSGAWNPTSYLLSWCEQGCGCEDCRGCWVTSMMCPGSPEPSFCHAGVLRPKFGVVRCLVSCPSYALTIAVSRNLCPNAVQRLLVQKSALFSERGLLKLKLSYHHSSFVD